MTIIKRADLGRPLTWDELDDNFQQVDDLTAATSAAVSSATASVTAAAGSAAASANSATAAAGSAADAANSVANAVQSTLVVIDERMGQWFPSAVSIFSETTAYSSFRVRGFYTPNDGGDGIWVATGGH